MPLFYIFLIFIFCFVLVKSADAVIKTLIYFANYFKLSKFITAFIAIGIATSLPELIVNISSSIHNFPSLILGNIIGSNIADITLILGLSILLSSYSLNTEERLTQKNIFYSALLVLYPIILSLDKNLSRFDGLLILLLFPIYLLFLIYQQKKLLPLKEKERAYKKDVKKYLLLGLISLFVLLLSAELIVRFSALLAYQIKIPLIIVGLFLLALGTSLPELALSLRSVKAKTPEIILGNLAGSLVANSTFILGLSIIISPFQIKDFPIFLVSVAFMVGSLFLYTFFGLRGKRFRKKEGLVLILFYVAFVIIQNLVS